MTYTRTRTMMLDPVHDAWSSKCVLRWLVANSFSSARINPTGQTFSSLFVERLELWDSLASRSVTHQSHHCICTRNNLDPPSSPSFLEQITDTPIRQDLRRRDWRRDHNRRSQRFHGRTVSSSRGGTFRRRNTHVSTCPVYGSCCSKRCSRPPGMLAQHR